MTDTTESLRRKIHSGRELKSVVRTMKVLAAASIAQYEKAVLALTDYNQSVELGLSVCFRGRGNLPETWVQPKPIEPRAVGAIVFGSDQGLVGRFNEAVADHAIATLSAMPKGAQIWAVGERVHERLVDAGLGPKGLFKVPNSTRAIATLVGELLLELEPQHSNGNVDAFYLFYNHPMSGAVYLPKSQRLLPLDEVWMNQFTDLPWSTRTIPEVIGTDEGTLRALIREYLFVLLYRASAESLASENASRLAAMQRAEKNIDELLKELNGTFHRLRQSGIDEELFDLVSGFESLTTKRS